MSAEQAREARELAENVVKHEESGHTSPNANELDLATAYLSLAAVVERQAEALREIEKACTGLKWTGGSDAAGAAKKSRLIAHRALAAPPAPDRHGEERRVDLGCPYCSAQPDEMCVTVMGKPRRDHKAREFSTPSPAPDRQASDG